MDHFERYNKSITRSYFGEPLRNAYHSRSRLRPYSIDESMFSPINESSTSELSRRFAQLDTRLQEVNELKNQLESRYNRKTDELRQREQDLLYREKQFYTAFEEDKQRWAKLIEDKLKKIKLREQPPYTETQQKLNEQAEILEQKELKLTHWQEKLESEQKDIDKASEMLEAVRDDLTHSKNELEKEQTRVLTQWQELEQTQKALNDLSSQLEKRTYELDRREDTLHAKESILSERREMLQKYEKAIEIRERALREMPSNSRRPPVTNSLKMYDSGYTPVEVLTPRSTESDH